MKGGALSGILGLGLLSLAAVSVGMGKPTPDQATGRSTWSFVENKGQWDSRALFLARHDGMNYWITRDGVVFDFQKFVPRPGAASHRMPEGKLYGDAVRMTLEGADPSSFHPSGAQAGVESYFIGKDKRRWATGLKHYSQVVCNASSIGASVRYYFDHATPRYDVVLQPGADPSRVAFQFDGAKALKPIDDGDIEIDTSFGPVIEKGLCAYQDINGVRSEVPSRMILDGNRVRFDAFAYDASKPLIIDPLVFSTFLGYGASQTSDNPPTASIQGLALDPNGNILVTGMTNEDQFPTTSGAYISSESFDNSRTAGFVSKLSADGSALLASTFLTSPELLNTWGQYVASDPLGNWVVAGFTNNTDFPTTPGCFQPTMKPVTQAIFIARLSSDGSSLLSSSYFGGSLEDWIGGLSLDSDGNIVMCGWTESSDFPTTANTYEPTWTQPAQGWQDAGWIAKLSSDETTLVSGTYFAVGASPFAVLANGGVAVMCDAHQNFTPTAGAYASSPIQGYSAGLAVLDSGLRQVVAATYIPWFLSGAVAVDSAGNIAIGGQTKLSGLPTTSGALQTNDHETYNNYGHIEPWATGYVAKFNSSLSQLQAATYLGGSTGLDGINGLALDSSGNAVVAGWTSATDFPVTSDAYQSTNQIVNGVGDNGFVSKISADGTSLIESTYFGGVWTAPSALTIDSDGHVFLAGGTTMGGFPTTAGAYEPSVPPTTNMWYGFISELSFSGLEGLSLSKRPVAGGVAIQASVSLGSNAPVGGSKVTLTSSGPVSVPAYVTVAAGKISAPLSIITRPVSKSSAASVTASLGTKTRSEAITVEPAPLSKLALSSSTVYGGLSVAATITLGGPVAASGDTVNLAVGSPASVQNSVLLTGRTGSFYIRTSPVSTSTLTTITATLGNSVLKQLFVIHTPQIASFTLTPATIASKGTVNARLAVSGATGPSGNVVTFRGPAGLDLPAEITIPHGQTSIQFSFKAYAVKTSTTVTVLADEGGSTRSVVLTITP